MTALLIVSSVAVAWVLLLMICTERDRRVHLIQVQARRDAERRRAQKARDDAPVTVR